MQTLVLTITLTSHFFAALPTWRKLRRKALPSMEDFAVLSLVLYYDLGLVVEVLGYYENFYFPPLFHGQVGTILLATGFIASAPWCFRLGASLVKGTGGLVNPAPVKFNPSRRLWFYALSAISAITITWIGIQFQGDAIWVARNRVGEVLGPFVIILYWPLYLLAFYVTTDDARSWFGLAYSGLLALASAVSTVVIGQRTTVLIPILILLLFRKRMSLQRMVSGALILGLLAALLLPMFKWQYAETDQPLWSLVGETIRSDFARAPVLASVLEVSDPLGTWVLPYPGAGYVYSALFLAPRQIVPFKGVATAMHFTSEVVGSPVEVTNWGFGVGVIEELALNFGLVLVPLGLLISGFLMGRLTRASTRWPSLVVPTRLAGLWLCGYHLPAILLLFGVMYLVGLVMTWVFASAPPLALEE